jgi:hypothetical protein
MVFTWSEALNHTRTCAELLIEWGKLQEKRFEVMSAQSLFRRAIDVSPSMTYAYQCLAMLEFRKGRIAEAREVFSRGLNVSEANRKSSPGAPTV